ncbi:MAG: N-acetylglucosamine-6-phosphate deacetylase [Firmicutes bacterium]|jgi:N-acetylglucosamine-6-phosphate deacetylase|nr:N-acetylglucosamine-6-phosphate deacetylase [Bacillota bacterium]
MSETNGQSRQHTGGDLLVRQGRLYTPEGFIDDGSVVISAGRIVFAGADGSLPTNLEVPWTGKNVRVTDLPVIEARDYIITPGFIDVHMHGGAGHDLMDGRLDSLQEMAAAHGRHGTTSLLAGAVTASQEALEAVAEMVKEAMDVSRQVEWGGAQVLGFHLEGPYINLEKVGAQNPAYVRSPSKDEIERLMEILGSGLRIITLAPEVPGALEVIPWLRERRVCVSLGHTAASYEEAMEAIAAGADHATHIFNAMGPLHHRDPGVVGAVLATPEVTAELIADGIHVHPGAMRVVWRAKGSSRICLVTDSGMAMDMPDGRYVLGELPVEVKDGVARLVEGGALASSTLGMDQAVRNMVELVGVPLEEALKMATAVPARQIGMSERKGSVEVGKDGDLCLLGPDLLCQRTIVGGRLLPRD